MNFIQRIGYGWLLFTESFFSIFRRHTNLVKIAALTLFAVVLLLTIFSITSTLLPAIPTVLHFPMFLILSLLFSIINAALYSYFSAFLQERNITPKAAFAYVIPHIGYILLWVVINSIMRDVIVRRTHLWPSWWKILFNVETTIDYPLTAVSFIGSLVQFLWNWLSLFVLPSIVLDNAGIIRALKTSVRIAVQRIPELIGFVLWSIIVGWALLLIVGGALSLLYLLAGIHWIFIILMYYCATLFVTVLLFAYALFIVALYLSSTGKLVSRLGDSRLQKYFSQQSQQNTMPVL